MGNISPVIPWASKEEVYKGVEFALNLHDGDAHRALTTMQLSWGVLKEKEDIQHTRDCRISVALRHASSGDDVTRLAYLLGDLVNEITQHAPSASDMRGLAAAATYLAECFEGKHE